MQKYSFSPRQIERAMAEAGKLKAELGVEDQKLLLDTIEGQTDVLEILDREAESIESDSLLLARADERIKRIQKRLDSKRDRFARILQALELSGSLERPLYTASLEYRRKAVVTDATALEEKYIRHAPDMILISKDLRAGTFTGEGATLGNPQPSLRITTK